MGRTAVLDALRRLSRNLWWSWDAEATRLFAELSPDAWEECGHNPVVVLRRVPASDLDARTAEPGYLGRLQATMQRFDAYHASSPELPPALGPDGATPAFTAAHPVAYFCAEFGVHESLPIYSGGLGILAGDHLKSASDLGIPLIGVGLFYRTGYMGQRLDEAGRQVAFDRNNDPAELPLEPVRDAAGESVAITVPVDGRRIQLRAWRVSVGRVALYLLDADTEANQPSDREITRQLYGGDESMRIQQEIVLGCGGVRLLRRLGIRPSGWHMNEGHAAFLTLERADRLVHEERMSFEAARERIRTTTMFTTHTPVPAGHDKFDHDLVKPHFSEVADRIGLAWDDFVALGRSDAEPDRFNMTVLALRFSSYCNGVSQLHRTASRQLLQDVWPDLPAEESPIDSITNGIHLATWTHPTISEGLGVTGRPVRGSDFVRNAQHLESADLWRRRQGLRTSLLQVVRRSLERTSADVPADALDDNALLIGFARRFAKYKRAHLLLSDPDRLGRLLGHPDRPVRILIAGKAHPRDDMGQDLLARVVAASRDDPLRGRIFFLEDYDIRLARALVQGVDVWLNTPTRMQEASGTSGMKAAANGALNLSIADGWWPEAADGQNGWTIAEDSEHDDPETQDRIDADALYRCLEEEVVPLFFERDAHDRPNAWLARVRHTLETIPPVFNTDRMVREYLDHAYRTLARACFVS